MSGVYGIWLWKSLQFVAEVGLVVKAVDQDWKLHWFPDFSQYVSP